MGKTTARKVLSNIDTKPVLKDDEPGKRNSPRSSAGKTLEPRGRVAEEALLEAAGMRFGDYPLFHAHINHLNRHFPERQHDASDTVHFPELRKSMRRAEHAMRRDKFQPGEITQKGPPELTDAIHQYVHHYASLYQGGGKKFMRIGEDNAFEDHEEDEITEARIVINHSTSNRALGQYSKRRDAIGAQAKAEKRRRAAERMSPSAALETIKKHVYGGRGKPKLRDFQAAIKMTHPMTANRAILAAAEERRKADNIRAFHQKVMRQVQKEVAGKHAAELDSVRNAYREVFSNLKTKSTKGPRTAAQKTVARKPKPGAKAMAPTTGAAKTRKRPAKKPHTVSQAHKGGFKPFDPSVSDKVLSKAQSSAEGAPQKVTDHDLQPKKSHIKVRPKKPPQPALEPKRPPDEIVQEPRKMVKGTNGTFPDSDRYLGRDGRAHRWIDLYGFWEDGEHPSGGYVPHERYNDDPRAKPPKDRVIRRLRQNALEWNARNPKKKRRWWHD